MHSIRTEEGLLRRVLLPLLRLRLVRQGLGERSLLQRLHDTLPPVVGRGCVSLLPDYATRQSWQSGVPLQLLLELLPLLHLRRRRCDHRSSLDLLAFDLQLLEELLALLLAGVRRVAVSETATESLSK